MISEAGRIRHGWEPIPVEPVFEPQPIVPVAVKLTLDRQQLIVLDRLLWGGSWPTVRRNEWASLGPEGATAGALLNLIHTAVGKALGDFGVPHYSAL